jgi:hypothetical protein
MKRAIPITTLFLDIGGVSLANEWDHLINPLLLRPCPQARCGHLSACVGHRTGASPAGSRYRKYLTVRPDRGRFRDSIHPSHGLHVYVRETGFFRIAEWKGYHQ